MVASMERSFQLIAYARSEVNAIVVKLNTTVLSYVRK